MSDTPKSTNTLSDYGILNPEACDPQLRSRIVSIIQACGTKPDAVTPEQLCEVATYINQLEDALLRYHWGSMEAHQINELLKCSTGLDIEARASEMAAMTASDA